MPFYHKFQDLHILVTKCCRRHFFFPPIFWTDKGNIQQQKTVKTRLG